MAFCPWMWQTPGRPGSGTYELTLADGKKLVRSDGTAIQYTEAWTASPATAR